MHITMISIGSTGDVRPYLLLGRELRSRGHEVTLCAFAAFEDMAISEGIRFCPLSGDVHTMIENMMNGSQFMTSLNKLRLMLKPILRPFLDDLMRSCEGAEAIIGTYFGAVLPSIAEKFGVPFIQTHYYPMDMNDSVPISSAPGLRAGRMWNRITYRVGNLIISSIESYYLASWRQEQGMSPRKLSDKPIYEIGGHQVPILYAMSPLLMPRPCAWDENIRMTGFWVDTDSRDFTPPESLTEFLSSGETPVYIGFGSMVRGDMGKTLHIVLEALRRSGLRAVLSKGWGVDSFVCDKNIYLADYLPHDWLFERVSAVVHHGGAGTTAAGVLAGKPTLVIPFGGDQPFWAARVRDLGVGPPPIRREALTVRRLTRALKDITTTRRYVVAAEELSERLRLENGTIRAADIIEQEVGKWLAQDRERA